MVPSRKEWTEALKLRHGEALYERFGAARVAVCGLGGLGSNIAIALIRAGVGRLLLIDYDRVDVTNLHRQQYKAGQVGELKTEALRENLLEINPYADIETVTAKITEENAAALLKNVDVVCEAFDKAENKAMLVNYVLEHMPDCYVVAANGMAGMDTPNSIRTERVGNHLYICGDAVSDVADGTGLVAARVMICAAHQAHTVLRIIAGEYEV